MRLAMITPTKDRPADLRQMLKSFAVQTVKPQQVVIVDASPEPDAALVGEFPELAIKYRHFTDKPSAAAQRNAGLALLDDDIELVGFFDDDQTLEPDALEKMLAFWQAERDRVVAGKTLGGAAFNQLNYADNRRGLGKRSKLAQTLGLYAAAPGRVAPSGWQSIIGKVSHNLDVEWFGAGYCVISRPLLAQFSFDHYFTGYSYLEDLDFSYSLSRQYRLTVVADAYFSHFHSPLGRPDQVRFGRMEVENRRYFVRKHGLSLRAYHSMMALRFGLTAFKGLRNKQSRQRALGNWIGFWGFAPNTTGANGPQPPA